MLVFFLTLLRFTLLYLPFYCIEDNSKLHFPKSSIMVHNNSIVTNIVQSAVVSLTLKHTYYNSTGWSHFGMWLYYIF